MSEQLRIIIAGGGTGGHFFPAMAIRDALIKKGVDVKYIGSKYGIEAKNEYLNKSFMLLNIRGIQRQLTFNSLGKNILFPFRFIQSYFISRKILKDFKPDIVIGTGGYSSGLPLIASINLGIATVIQEQNSYPGITTRYLSKYCNKTFIAYQDAKRYLKKKNFILTGNPIRDSIQMINKNKAKNNLNLNEKKPVLLILGGSQGSKPLNNHFIKKCNEYLQYGIQILWQCGKTDFNNLNKLINNKDIHLIPFCDDMSLLYSASDLIISRSGALALSEMAFMGKAMILIPFPYSAGNHQFKNAESFSNSGAAILIPQNKLNSGQLEHAAIKLLKNPEKIVAMEKKSIQLASPDATDIIANSIIEMAAS